MARKRRRSKNRLGTWLILAAGVYLLTRKRTTDTDTAGIDPMDVPVKTGPVVAVGKKRPTLTTNKNYL